MTDETMRAELSAFEEWAGHNYLRIGQLESRWAAIEMAWQSALTAERTRCAQIARAHGRDDIAAEIEGAE